MKREEKNQQTRRRIIESALAEFSAQGYGASSINTISSAENLSKGIVYHYFETKDDLFLACVRQCFEELTRSLLETLCTGQGEMEEQLSCYFQTRMRFFQENPAYQRIFCDAVISPPTHLEAAIEECRAPFDTLNIEILDRLLEPVALRADITRQEVVETFRQYQDFINARCRMSGVDEVGLDQHEASCRRALSILLYGIISREGQLSWK